TMRSTEARGLPNPLEGTMKNKDMQKSSARYDFIFDGRQAVSEYDVVLGSDVAAIAHAYSVLGELEYPPAHGGDMTSACSIFVNNYGSRAFVCNVNTEGEVDFVE
uniref:hypothetical protein n=1 Tax=Paratractidigestivibacter sp. TaxID=2847316 RepID=UPI002AC8A977